MPARSLTLVGLPFVERPYILRGILDAGTGPIHFGNWRFAAQDQSETIAPSVPSLPRHAQQAHSSLQRYEGPRGYPAALATPSLPMTLLRHNGQQRNEHARSLV